MYGVRFLIFLTSLFFVTHANADTVEKAQVMLQQLGFNVGFADGIYGRKTEKSLKDFYDSIGSSFDGKLNENELSDLSNYLNQSVKYCRRSENIVVLSNETDNNFIVENLYSLIETSIPFYQEGTFGSETSALSKSESSPIITSVGDLNLDGIDDLLIEYIETMVPPIVLMGTKTGNFKRLENVDLSSARRHIRKGYFKDVNNDGYLDFIGFTTSDHIEYFQQQGINNLVPGEADVLLLNQGGTGFKEITIPEAHKNDVNHGGIVSDINWDGLLDIIPLSEDDGKASFPLINRGKGKFDLSNFSLPNIVTKYWIEDGESGDLNGDGFDDYVISLQVPYNTYIDKLEDHRTLAIIYGDGDLDFGNNTFGLIGEYWFNRQILEELSNYQNTKFQSTKFSKNIAERNIAFGTANIELADINGDGRLDILEAQFMGKGMWVTSGFNLYINEPGCFREATYEFFPNQIVNRNIAGSKYTNYVNNFYFADINNDGLTDLLLQSFDGAAWLGDEGRKQFPFIFIRQQDQTFLPIKTIFSSNLIDVSDMVVGDFNGDGKNDLAGVKNFNIATYLFDPKPENKYWRDSSSLLQKFECFMIEARRTGLTNLPSEYEIGRTIVNITDNKGYLRPKKIIESGISEKVFQDHKNRITRLINYEGPASQFCEKPILR